MSRGRGPSRATLRQIELVLRDDGLFSTTPEGWRRLEATQIEMASRLSELAELDRPLTPAALFQRLGPLRKRNWVRGSRSQLVFDVRAIKAAAAGRVVHLAAAAQQAEDVVDHEVAAMTADGSSLEEIRTAKGWSSRGTAQYHRRRLADAVVLDESGSVNDTTDYTDRPIRFEGVEAGGRWVAGVEAAALAWIDRAFTARAAGEDETALSALRIVGALAGAGQAAESIAESARGIPRLNQGVREASRESIAESSRSDQDFHSLSMNGLNQSTQGSSEVREEPAISTPPSNPRSTQPAIPACDRRLNEPPYRWPAEELGDALAALNDECARRNRPAVVVTTALLEAASAWPRELFVRAVEILVTQVREQDRIDRPGGVLQKAAGEGWLSYFPTESPPATSPASPSPFDQLRRRVKTICEPHTGGRRHTPDTAAHLVARELQDRVDDRDLLTALACEAHRHLDVDDRRIFDHELVDELRAATWQLEDLAAVVEGADPDS